MSVPNMAKCRSCGALVAPGLWAAHARAGCHAVRELALRREERRLPAATARRQETPSAAASTVLRSPTACKKCGRERGTLGKARAHSRTQECKSTVRQQTFFARTDHVFVRVQWTRGPDLLTLMKAWAPGLGDYSYEVGSYTWPRWCQAFYDELRLVVHEGTTPQRLAEIEALYRKCEAAGALVPEIEKERVLRGLQKFAGLNGGR